MVPTLLAFATEAMRISTHHLFPIFVFETMIIADSMALAFFAVGRGHVGIAVTGT